MNKENEFKAKWNVTKAKLQQKFTNLTDKDLHLEDGKQDVLLNNLQQKLGKTEEELNTIISELK